MRKENILYEILLDVVMFMTTAALFALWIIE
jgi:hypothetical protein